MNIDDELDFMEVKENMKNAAEYHYAYFERMKELCDEKYNALLFTQSMILGMFSNKGGE